MPIMYSGINEEHVAVRERAGVFDVSHMGEFLVKGPKALDLIQITTSNDAAKLTPGKAQYSCLLNHSGGIVDDLLVYMMRENEYLLVVNASNRRKDFDWIQQFNNSGTELTDISDDITLLAVQGPKAIEILQKLTAADLRSIPYYGFTIADLGGVKDVIISATGYTGAGGFELYFKNAFAEQLWNKIFEAGQPYGIMPAGLAARDTLRIEMGYCLYGNDIDDTTSPLEAGLGWITKFNKEFTAKEVLLKQRAEGIKRKLTGIELIEKGIPRQGYKILNGDGYNIGVITSGTMSPTLKKPIGLGYISADQAAPGNTVYVDIRNNPVRAKVMKAPFVKASTLAV